MKIIYSSHLLSTIVKNIFLERRHLRLLCVWVWQKAFAWRCCGSVTSVAAKTLLKVKDGFISCQTNHGMRHSKMTIISRWKRIEYYWWPLDCSTEPAMTTKTNTTSKTNTKSAKEHRRTVDSAENENMTAKYQSPTQIDRPGRNYRMVRSWAIICAT